MLRQLIGTMLACVALSGCDNSGAPAPPTVPPSSGERITGTERLGWDQSASKRADLSIIRYAIYVDGTRSELAGATCETIASDVGFPCSARLPPLTAGPHTLELAAFVMDGSRVLESARSAPLRVIVGTSISKTQALADGVRDLQLSTVDGIGLHVERVTTGLNQPTDLASLPDGRLLVAETAGTVRVVRDGHLRPSSLLDGTPLALAVDPNFAETHHVFALAVSPARVAGPAFSVLRFTEWDDRLVDRVVMLDEVLASRNPHGALRFGPDGKLYAAFDDGDAPQRSEDLASPNGKILRLNPDGTTPADQDQLTPMFSHGFRSPRGLDWQPETRALWIADSADTEMLYSVRAAERKVRGVVDLVFRLPPPTQAVSLAFYRSAQVPAFTNNLFIASAAEGHLLRIVFDPREPSRVRSTERLLRNQLGALRALVEHVDGALYVATATDLMRITPSRDPR